MAASFIKLCDRKINIRIHSLSLIVSSRSGSSAVNIENDADSSLSSIFQSWPELDQFVGKLKSKGFFEKTEDESFDATSSPQSVLLNRVKHACMEFARQRYDIIRSLPKEDIKNIVECGCPNLLKKAVNSAKRLRSYLQLDEAEVCGACKLRGSCDRAYTIDKENDKARTVDIMRIILSYATEPALNLGQANPSLVERVQLSARKLIGEMSKLSDTSMDPELLKPEIPNRKQSLKEPQNLFNSNDGWRNFDENESQGEPKGMSRNKETRNVEMKRGDWLCPSCNFLNFARNLRCLECKADGPQRVDFNNQEMKLGDWTCPKCDFMNYARNRKCFRCLETRPKRELNPGEWECTKCFYINFKRNIVCKRCDGERPAYSENSSFEDEVALNEQISTSLSKNNDARPPIFAALVPNILAVRSAEVHG